MDNYTGQKLGRLEILERIGEGGMATVFRAYDPEITRSLAIKILREEHCQSADYVSRFLKEGRAAGALTHPNIVTIYDVGTVEGAPYISMELLTGTSLAEHMNQGETFTVEQILNCALKIADALDYAHRQQVVHRDIKPDNVLFDVDSGDLKIADFGIARQNTNEVSDLTQAGAMLGTPRYMSPEQALGNAIDGRSDLFSLGLIMYEMATGRPAFNASSLTSLVLEIVQRDPPAIRKSLPKVPSGFEKIISKLIEKEPARRYQSGAELRVALLNQLSALQGAREEQSRYLPLQVKWTVIMAGVVAVALGITSTIMLRAQHRMLTDQLVDSGVALTSFVAAQAAIPVLGDDWISLEALVLDASARDNFSHLMISDHKGTVRVANDPQYVDRATPTYEGHERIYDGPAIDVVDTGDGSFNFSAPVLFNGTKVGAIDVGLNATSIDDAMDTTTRMLIALAIATLLTLSAVIYFLNKSTARQLQRVTRALKMFAADHLETRLMDGRKNEFGDLYQAFNQMADAIGKRVRSKGNAGKEDDSGADEDGATTMLLNWPGAPGEKK